MPGACLRLGVHSSDALCPPSARRLQVTSVSSLDPTVRAHGARETRPRFASGRNQTVLRCTEPSPLPGKQPPPRSEAWGFPAPPLPPALRSGELRPGPVTRPHRKGRCPRYDPPAAGRTLGHGGTAERRRWQRSPARPLIGHAPNGSSPQGPPGSHAPPRSRATGRTRIGDGPQEPEAAAVTRPRATQQVPSGGGTARARQEAPPPGRGGGVGCRSDRWAGGRAGVRGVSATPPRRRRRMSQRLPGEQQAAPPGQVWAELGPACLLSSRRRAAARDGRSGTAT